MYFFIEKSRQIQSRSESMSIDFQELYTNTIQKFYQKYSLPALHEWGDGFCKGDASDDEIIELAQEINRLDGDDSPVVFAEISDEDELLTDVFEYLDNKFIEMLESELESQICQFGDEEFTKDQFDKYKEQLEDKIKEFLNENYYSSPEQIGHDWSLWANLEEIEVFEQVHPSSNWMFQEADSSRFRIAHLNNYDNPFEECDYDLVVTTAERPEDWDEMSQKEKKEWFEEEDEESIDQCHEYNRDEAIEKIIENIEWREVENWFDSQFETTEEEE